MTEHHGEKIEYNNSLQESFEGEWVWVASLGYGECESSWVPEIAYNGQIGGWFDESYRTIILDEPATGDLLTFLQANATKIS